VYSTNGDARAAHTGALSHSAPFFVRHRPRRLRLSLPPNFLLDCLSSDRRTRLRGIALPVSPLPSKPTPWSQPTSDYLVTYSSPQASHRDHPSGWQQAELLLGDFVRRSAPASKKKRRLHAHVDAIPSRYRRAKNSAVSAVHHRNSAPLPMWQQGWM